MELETTAKKPLLSNYLESPLENPNSYEDNIPIYAEFASKDPFSLESLFQCSCLQSRNSLTHKEFLSFQRLSLYCKKPINLDLEDQKRILRGIWNELFLNENPPLESRLSHEKWKDIGFQNSSPDSDFRSGGLMALKNMRVFVETNKDLVREIIRNQEKEEFLFAISSINVSFFLKKYFLMAEPVDYKQNKDLVVCSKSAFKSFCGFLHQDDEVLEKMHDFILKDLYYTWRKKKANNSVMNIMAFNAVFKEIQAIFHRKLIKFHLKGFEIMEKKYIERLERLNN